MLVVLRVLRRMHVKHRIQATFNPPPQYLKAGALPERVERECAGLAEMSEQLRELVYAGSTLLNLGASVSIEITRSLPSPPSRDLK